MHVGDASYSIYLSHPFCLSIFGKIILAMGLSGGYALIASTIAGFIALGIGLAVYHLLEKPMIHASKAYFSYRKNKVAAQVTP